MKNLLLKTSISAIFLFLVASCQNTAENNNLQKELPFPKIWMSYDKVKSYDEDFSDLKKHGVGAVVISKSSEGSLPCEWKLIIGCM